MKRLCLTLAVLFALALPAAAQHSNTLSWTWSMGTGGSATGFIVQRSTTSGGPYMAVCGGTGQPTCPDVSTLTYVDTAGLTDGAVWFYVIVATGPGGNAPPSNEVKAVTPFLSPNAASGVSVVSK